MLPILSVATHLRRDNRVGVLAGLLRSVCPTLGAPASSPALCGQPAKCPGLSGYPFRFCCHRSWSSSRPSVYS